MYRIVTRCLCGLALDHSRCWITCIIILGDLILCSEVIVYRYLVEYKEKQLNIFKKQYKVIETYRNRLIQ